MKIIIKKSSCDKLLEYNHVCLKQNKTKQSVFVCECAMSVYE